MRRQVVIKNGKKYLVNVPDWQDGQCGWLDGVGSGSIIPYLPVIGSQPPATSSVSLGSDITLTVYAGPAGPFDYIAFQWQTSSLNLIDGGTYTGSMTNLLTIHSASAPQEGMYNVIITNQYGSITSSYYWVDVV